MSRTQCEPCHDVGTVTMVLTRAEARVVERHRKEMEARKGECYKIILQALNSTVNSTAEATALYVFERLEEFGFYKETDDACQED